MCHVCACSCGCPKKALDLLKLELQDVLTCVMWVLLSAEPFQQPAFLLSFFRVCERETEREKMVLDDPGARVMGGCELSVVAGNQTRVL